MFNDCNCKLCCSGILPGKESHIFSNFLITETLYKEGKASPFKNFGRDHDLIFCIRPFDSINMYLKGSTTEEALKYLNKDEFNDEELEEIKKSENPLTDKLLVCSRCEDSFNPIETEFKKIYLKVINTTKNFEEFTLNEAEYPIYKIFILLNIWRASESEKLPWKLNDSSRDFLTFYLFNVFNLSCGKLENILMNYHNIEFNEVVNPIYNRIVSKFSIITFINNKEPDMNNSPNGNCITCYYSSRPYCILINRMCILFSENNFDDIGIPKILQNSITLGDKVTQPNRKIFILPEAEMIQIYKNVIFEQIESTKKHIKDLFLMGYKKFYNKHPTPDLIFYLFPFLLDTVQSGYKHGNFGHKVLNKILEYIQINKPETQ